MRKILFGVLVCLLVLLPSALLAQSSNNTIGEIHVNVPKPGGTAQYEDGRKRHMQWHAGQKDTWAWYVWEVTTGDSTGAYVVGSFGHHWKDFDVKEAFTKADGVDAIKNVSPSLSHEEMSYWVFRADMSSGKEGPPAKMITVAHYWIDPSMGTVFTDSIKKVNAGIEKTKYPGKHTRWYQLANGGEGPHFVVVTDRANMSDMEPLEKTLDAMMAEAYGAEDGKATMDTLRKTIRKVSSELLEYRADLSYVPK